VQHGVKRVRYTKEAIEEKRKREQAKLKEYLALTEDVISRKKRKDWSKEALDLTLRVLRINPEHYTVWNYRRNILLNGVFPASSAKEINDFISDELGMTMAALKANPKVYWLWNHRRWCLESVPEGPGLIGDDELDPVGWKKASWERELSVVERMLDVDPRNFHAWDYRRYILASIPVKRPETSELAYTTHKIESNFSNFSAWHQRSKVFISLWESGQLDAVESKEQEFDLVRNAMYTDPDDQSVWVYHRWLIGLGHDRQLLEREISSIQELLDEQPDSKWCMESLVYYKRLLLQRHDVSSKDVIRRECEDLVEKLMIIDPARQQRYKDIETEIAVGTISGPVIRNVE